MSDLLANKIREALVVARRLWMDANNAISEASSDAERERLGEECRRLWSALVRLEGALGDLAGIS